MKTPDEILSAALTMTGVPYKYGAEAKVDEDVTALDCSELIELVCDKVDITPCMPDGSWKQYQHCCEHETEVSVQEALNTRGALLFIFSSDPSGKNRPKRSHVAFSLGNGSTFEANVRGTRTYEDAASREWTFGALIPGVSYPITPDDVRLINAKLSAAQAKED